MDHRPSSRSALVKVLKNSTTTASPSPATSHTANRNMFTVDYILSDRSSERDPKSRRVSPPAPVTDVSTQHHTSERDPEPSSNCHLKRKVQKVYPLQADPRPLYATDAQESWPEDKFSRSSSSSSTDFASYGKGFESGATDAYYSSSERSSTSPTSSPFYDSGVSETDSPPREDVPKCHEEASNSSPSCGMDYVVVDALTDEEVGKAENDSGHEKKKKKKRRVLFTKLQTRELERRFYSSFYISPQERDVLAKDLNMDPDQVKIWFQNHRYKLKKYHKENGDRGFAPTLPYFRGGPYPMLMRDSRRPELIKDGLGYDFAKEHTLGDYIKDPRIFDAAKSLSPTLFTAPCHPKQIMALNRLIPSYSGPVVPFAHPYSYELPYSNYYLSPNSPLLGHGPLTSAALSQAGTSLPGASMVSHPMYNSPMSMVFGKPVV